MRDSTTSDELYHQQQQAELLTSPVSPESQRSHRGYPQGKLLGNPKRTEMRKDYLKEYEPLLMKGGKEPKGLKFFCFQFPNKFLLLAMFATCIGGTFQCGYNISVINAPTKYVQDFINQTWMQRYQTEISKDGLTLLWSTIVSIFTIGGFIGVSIGGTLSVKLGRRGTLLTNNVISLAAALLMGLSSSAGSFELLIIGRLLIGINAGKYNILGTHLKFSLISAEKSEQVHL
ncbi:hypothetical protein ATANTOWER_023095 [Ataeniobius toweri]|uniref:Major facilitator superfamily (MFS) profile domain-containing protein n=1 Tax=Ataeniobius toweri TaxID=208326 RepID=A0ABU7B8I5_9TELE|nr:hypothetical protein [Ataeniobius toweri]